LGEDGVEQRVENRDKTGIEGGDKFGFRRDVEEGFWQEGWRGERCEVQTGGGGKAGERRVGEQGRRMAGGTESRAQGEKRGHISGGTEGDEKKAAGRGGHWRRWQPTRGKSQLRGGAAI